MFSPTKKERELNKNQKNKQNQNQQGLTNGQQVALIQNGNKQNGDTKRNGKGKNERRIPLPYDSDKDKIPRFANKAVLAKCGGEGHFEG